MCHHYQHHQHRYDGQLCKVSPLRCCRATARLLNCLILANVLVQQTKLPQFGQCNTHRSVTRMKLILWRPEAVCAICVWTLGISFCHGESEKCQNQNRHHHPMLQQKLQEHRARRGGHTKEDLLLFACTSTVVWETAKMNDSSN